MKTVYLRKMPQIYLLERQPITQLVRNQEQLSVRSCISVEDTKNYKKNNKQTNTQTNWSTKLKLFLCVQDYRIVTYIARTCETMVYYDVSYT